MSQIGFFGGGGGGGSGPLNTLSGNTGTATPVSNNINVVGGGGGNITTTGSGDDLTIVVSGTTNHAVQVGNSTGSLHSLAVGTTGQVLTGNTGADPSWQTPASTAISITGDSGGTLTGTSFTFTGGTTGLTFNGAVLTETLAFAGITANNGVVNLGTDNAANAINIGLGTTARTIKIGFSIADHDIHIGVGAGAASVDIESGSGGATLNSVGGVVSVTGSAGVTVDSAAGDISIGTGSSAQNVFVGTGAGAKTVDVGSTHTTSTTNLQSGSGGINIPAFIEGALITSSTGLVTSVTGTAGFVLTANAPGTAPSFQVAGGGGFTWTVETTSVSMVSNNGYISNSGSLISLALPATAAVGDILRVTGLGSGGWSITQGASQQINFGANPTTSGASGTLSSTNQFDSVELVCVVADDTWNVLSSVGNLAIV